MAPTQRQVSGQVALLNRGGSCCDIGGEHSLGRREVALILEKPISNIDFL